MNLTVVPTQIRVKIMELNKISKFSATMIVALIAILGSSFGLSAQARSYMTSQILTQGAYGPIAEVPQNQGDGSHGRMMGRPSRCLTVHNGVIFKIIMAITIIPMLEPQE